VGDVNYVREIGPSRSKAHVWMMEDYVLVTDEPGPPVGAKHLIGSYPMPDTGWGQAKEVAEAIAKERGLEISYHSIWF
jgi:hypothetical protein